MPGSMDDRQVQIVNASKETLLTVLVYPDGRVQLLTPVQDRGWVVETLRRLADTVETNSQAEAPGA